MADKGGREPASRVLELFEEGRKFTEELLKENERLRAAIVQARAEVRDLQNQRIRPDVEHMQKRLASAEEELAILRKENASLKAEFKTVEDENREFADRYVLVERQNSDLVSLYVASQRLHSTLSYDEVVAIVKEIVINLVGSEMFAVYVVDSAAAQLVLVGQEGMDQSAAPTVPFGVGVLGETAVSGRLYIAAEGRDMHQQGPDPIACIPLRIGDQVLGAIAIYALLRQKPAFRAVDLEMFELLGGHAAGALYVSSVYAVSERKRATLEGLMGLLKSH